jgi:hypothetical protein
MHPVIWIIKYSGRVNPELKNCYISKANGTGRTLHAFIGEKLFWNLMSSLKSSGKILEIT